MGAVAFDPSMPLRPPQPPTIQSYHMKIGRSGLRRSRPPTRRYSRLKQQAIARSGMTSDQSSKIEFMIFSYGPEQKPVTATGHSALTTVPGGPMSTWITR